MIQHAQIAAHSEGMHGEAEALKARLHAIDELLDVSLIAVRPARIDIVKKNDLVSAKLVCNLHQASCNANPPGFFGKPPPDFCF
jgi:hypothetical protein